MAAPLPKYLIADDGGDRDFVVHCHWPRFIMEYVDGVGTPQFLDAEKEIVELELAAGREPAVLLARLMREAGDFFVEQTREY